VGGLLVIGVGDAGEVHGIDRLGQEYANKVLSFYECIDGPMPEHKIVDCVRDDGSPDHLIFIYTPFLQNRVARTTDGVCWTRQGDKPLQLQWDKCQELAYQKGELHFEDEPAISLNEQDLEPGIVREFIEQCVQQKH
jgi:predicted HTH transcriptional regulator